ncbi:MAG TPA: tRNA (adenosine(37)-N6)-threonylcarbamoyltransferase complex ATPase subunit type 1 TsaE [Pararhizobium sp.]|nr:tRNA (adenosine(37)-N6)-threonylcarbamoyltransferase complex ATPase subunit type 1 TsaE [Pararhizobium sp.]
MPPIVIDLIDENAMIRLGEDLALALRPGDCLALSGALGAGKSTLARALIRALAGDPALDVPSPTFTLVQTYDLRFPIAHFDLYRIADPAELDELGIDEALFAGAALVEWPENAGAALPADAVTIRIEEHRRGRRVTIGGPEAFLRRIGRSLEIRAFLGQAGRGEAERRYLVGDASPRAYETIRPPAGPPLILMNAPPLPFGPILRDGKRYTQIAHIAEDARSFVAIDGLLRSYGLSAPEIIASDLDEGLILLEDFGSEGVLDADGRPIPERYEAAIDVLAVLHRHAPRSSLPLPTGERYEIPLFDRAAMAIEVEQILEWYVPWKAGATLDQASRAEFLALWDRLIDLAQASEQNVLLRDVHSPNLFWLPERPGAARIGLIDFQDAMIGPTAYDVASLVQDARVTVEPELAGRLIERYIMHRHEQSAGFDGEAFEATLAIMAAQRVTKILGIFVRLKLRDGKPGYLRHLPRLERYLAANLDHPVLHPLRDFYSRVGILPNES